MRKLELKDIVGYLPYDLHIMRRAWDEVATDVIVWHEMPQFTKEDKQWKL